MEGRWEGSPGPGNRARALTPHPVNPGFKFQAASTKCFTVALLEISLGLGHPRKKCGKRPKSACCLRKCDYHSQCTAVSVEERAGLNVVHVLLRALLVCRMRNLTRSVSPRQQSLQSPEGWSCLMRGSSRVLQACTEKQRGPPSFRRCPDAAV